MGAMFRGSVLLLALVLAGPTLWSAFVNHQISTNTALIRFLIAVPAAAILLGAMRFVMTTYNKREKDTPPTQSK
jgi:hypothetical protein